jgi:NADPH-dependent 2,4-dienoyl-CoA reductase/sulfur reductase-like enzyme
MAAASMLADCGVATTLFEARADLGGGLVSSANPPGKAKLFWYRDWLARQLALSGVAVRAGVTADADAVAALAPDLVVLAHGPRLAPVDIPGADLPHVRHAYDVVRDAGPFGPGPIVVYGGGETGCETAELAAERGFDVVVVSRSPLRQLARAAEGVYRRVLIDKLKANARIRIVAETHLTRIGRDSVTLTAADGTAQELPAGQVILAQGRIVDGTLAAALKARGLAVETIGDAREIRRIGEAVNEAYLAVRTFTGTRAAAQ